MLPIGRSVKTGKAQNERMFFRLAPESDRVADSTTIRSFVGATPFAERDVMELRRAQVIPA
jgi:hypothetical protein